MVIFSCPACGSRAFTLSADLSEPHCAACAKPLGSWQELRQEIRKRLSCSGQIRCDAPPASTHTTEDKRDALP